MVSENDSNHPTDSEMSEESIPSQLQESNLHTEDGVPDRTPLVERGDSTPISSLEVQVLTGNGILTEDELEDPFFDPLAAYVIEEHVDTINEADSSFSSVNKASTREGTFKSSPTSEAHSNNSTREVVQESTAHSLPVHPGEPEISVAEGIPNGMSLGELSPIGEQAFDHEPLSDRLSPIAEPLQGQVNTFSPYEVTEEDFAQVPSENYSTEEGTYSVSLVKGVAKLSFVPNEAFVPNEGVVSSETSALPSNDSDGKFSADEEFDSDVLIPSAEVTPPSESLADQNTPSFKEIMERERREMAEKLGIIKPSTPPWKKPLHESTQSTSQSKTMFGGAAEKWGGEPLSISSNPTSYNTTAPATNSPNTQNALPVSVTPIAPNYSSPPSTAPSTITPNLSAPSPTPQSSLASPSIASVSELLPIIQREVIQAVAHAVARLAPAEEGYTPKESARNRSKVVKKSRKLTRMERALKILRAVELLSTTELDPVSARLAKVLKKRVLKSLEAEMQSITTSELEGIKGETSTAPLAKNTRFRK